MASASDEQVNLNLLADESPTRPKVLLSYGARTRCRTRLLVCFFAPLLLFMIFKLAGRENSATNAETSGTHHAEFDPAATRVRMRRRVNGTRRAARLNALGRHP